MKLIRRPNLIIVSGISLNTKIQNRKCEDNDTWLAEARKRNGAGLERVEWLYSTKELRKRRDDPQKKKGSIILTVDTEETQNKLVREGLLVGGEWFPVQLWDVSLKEEQCFRCLKWGHHQSVCNSPQEYCGHCAGKHATKDCTKTGKEYASCAGCKKRGHVAWEMSKCPEFKKSKTRNAEIKTQLARKTALIQGGTVTPAYSFNAGSSSTASLSSSKDSTAWITVKRLGKRRRVAGRPPDISRAASQPGQTRLVPTQMENSPNVEDTIIELSQ